MTLNPRQAHPPPRFLQNLHHQPFNPSAIHTTTDPSFSSFTENLRHHPSSSPLRKRNATTATLRHCMSDTRTELNSPGNPPESIIVRHQHVYRPYTGGYRGAWFKCKILKIFERSSGMSYLFEYPDYPDQKSTQIKVYQKATHINKSKGLNKVLMVRPHFLTIYRENEKLDVNAISEVVVIVDDAWRIGDLVDWFSDGCYWCGKVTELIGTDKVQIDLLSPPHGEGDSMKL